MVWGWIIAVASIFLNVLLIGIIRKKPDKDAYIASLEDSIAIKKNQLTEMAKREKELKKN